jgi:lipoprotein Spr
LSIDFGERARALVGTPFRLQGRGAGALDCVGVTLSTFGLPVDGVPRSYRLRGDHLGVMREQLVRFFRRVPATQLKAGDLMLMKVSNEQAHLGVRTERGFVHAHAGLRMVVETPGLPEWPLIGVYRKRR